MLVKIRNRLSYANITATLALFIALGGVSYAAVTLPKNSVGSAQIKANAVTAAKVKNSSLTGADIKNKSLTANDFSGSVQGPQGPAGPRGESGGAGPIGATGAAGAAGATNVVVRREEPCPTLPANVHCVINIQCEAGERAIGGGAGFTTFAGNEFINASHPVEADGSGPENGDTPTGWFVSIEYTTGGPRNAIGYVVCVSP
jgi:hypothetical protein